jgi:hypothetical protein
MASTRNLNTPQDYRLEKRRDQQVLDYRLYTGSAKNESPGLFRDGPNPKMYGGILDKNMVDVESMLRGIRSTDLEGESFHAMPETQKLEEISYFTKTPIVIPPSFTLSRERPSFLA